MRKNYSPQLKARVAIEALKEQRTVAELSSFFQVPVTQVSNWKKKAKENLPKVFSQCKSQVDKEKDELIERLYRQLGKLQMEHEWLKKKLEIS